MTAGAAGRQEGHMVRLAGSAGANHNTDTRQATADSELYIPRL